MVDGELAYRLFGYRLSAIGYWLLAIRHRRPLSRFTTFYRG